MWKDRILGLGGKVDIAKSAELAGEHGRVLMLTDITTDMRSTDKEVDAVRLQAQAAGFDEPVLLNVGGAGAVDVVVGALKAAKETGKPFDILVEDIWSRAGLLEAAKAQQPGLHITVIADSGAQFTAPHLWENPLIDNVVLKRDHQYNLASQLEIAFAIYQLPDSKAVRPHRQAPGPLNFV
jgi:hypothetical protein